MAGRKLPLIEVGFSVFVGDGSDSCGAVRRVMPGGVPELLVNIENAGDFRVPLDAVEKVASRRVVLAWDRLDPALQEAIRHSRDGESFPPADEPEAEILHVDTEDPDEDDASRYDAPPAASPPTELPGRDAGRYGAPTTSGPPTRRR